MSSDFMFNRVTCGISANDLGAQEAFQASFICLLIARIWLKATSGVSGGEREPLIRLSLHTRSDDRLSFFAIFPRIKLLLIKTCYPSKQLLSVVHIITPSAAFLTILRPREFAPQSLHL